MAEPLVYKAEIARDKLRDILDHVGSGGVVYIQRYNRVDGVVISPREYERLQNDHRRLIEYLKAEPWENDIVFAPGETITPESLERKAKAKEWRQPALEPA
jgi:hypothetical protein